MPDVYTKISDRALAAFAIVFFIAFHYLLLKVGSGWRRWIRQASAHLFHPFVAERDRRKAIQAMQKERKQRGLPPLENPFF
jgi:hypothetical protein